MDVVLQTLKRRAKANPADVEAWEKYAVALERMVGFAPKKQVAVLGRYHQSSGWSGPNWGPNYPIVIPYQENDDLYRLFYQHLEKSDGTPDASQWTLRDLHLITEIWILDEGIDVILKAMYKDGVRGNDTARDCQCEDALSLCRNLASKIITITDDDRTKDKKWKQYIAYDEDIYVCLSREQYHQNPTLENYRIFWLAWKESGYVGHEKGTCHGPECGERVGHDYDGGHYLYCDKHNKELYLEFCLSPDQEEKQAAIFEEWCEKLANEPAT